MEITIFSFFELFHAQSVFSYPTYKSQVLCTVLIIASSYCLHTDHNLHVARLSHTDPACFEIEVLTLVATVKMQNGFVSCVHVYTVSKSILLDFFSSSVLNKHILFHLFLTLAISPVYISTLFVVTRTSLIV